VKHKGHKSIKETDRERKTSWPTKTSALYLTLQRVPQQNSKAVYFKLKQTYNTETWTLKRERKAGSKLCI
jgi:hypothetical protein